MKLKTTKKKTRIKGTGTGKGLSKKRLIIIIAAAVLLLAVGITVAVVLSMRSQQQAVNDEDGKTVLGISMNFYPTKRVYYVGEEFDPNGIRIQVRTKGQEYTTFIDDVSKLKFSGFDSSVPNDKLVITVEYEGWTTTFDLVVKEKEKPTPKLVSIEVYNLIDTYNLEEWNYYGPDVSGARIRCHYDDGSVKEDIILKNAHINGFKKLNAPGTTEITVKYNDGVTTVETTVTITVTE